jgi:hypothetical protein
MLIIYPFQAVNIDHDDGKGLCMTHYPCDFLLQNKIEGTHVQQACQVICL